MNKDMNDHHDIITIDDNHSDDDVVTIINEELSTCVKRTREDDDDDDSNRSNKRQKKDILDDTKKSDTKSTFEILYNKIVSQSNPNNIPSIIKTRTNSNNNTIVTTNNTNVMKETANSLPKRNVSINKRKTISLFDKSEIQCERMLMALNYIITWINFRLIEKKFCKETSGIYIWSYQRSVGKTALCNVLAKIFKFYFWSFEDKEWQQDWEYGDNYDCIVYNAINSALLKFRQIENHGDRNQITVMKRNQRKAGHIKPDTPFIITSNKPAEKLGYDEKDMDINVWKDRMIIVCVDNIPLFPLIDRIIEQFNIVFKKEDPIPDIYKTYREI
jgi:hypothetical protein